MRSDHHTLKLNGVRIEESDPLLRITKGQTKKDRAIDDDEEHHARRRQHGPV